MQKLTLQQREVVRFTHVPPKTQNWAYSGLENKEPQNLSRNIYGRILSFFLFAEIKCRHTKYTQIVRVNYQTGLTEATKAVTMSLAELKGQ